MLTAFRWLAIALETVLALPFRIVNVFIQAFVFNPRLGPLRHLVTLAVVYVLFAVTLVYVVAPLRGLTGRYWYADKLQYDNSRWLATAIYDRNGNFVGTFDPRLDSKQDVNYSGVPIELAAAGYVANPDHKSIPVRQAPEYFWRCLVYHEDRHIGTWLNPAGIDFLGVLKIPASTIRRSFASGRPRLGVGGSTIPMQLARVIYKSPPSASEGALVKLRRKLAEWWMAPVIYAELTRNGDAEPLKEWAANHLWLAQRGGGDLHGVELTARIVFGKEARDLTVAEQFVLASAVNKPIILLDGGERLNAVRDDRWKYVVDVRARKCASELVSDPETQKEVFFELTTIAHGPPDPLVRPELEVALSELGEGSARIARANPALRANLLIPAARYGVREEMKQEYGFEWREYVRGVNLTFSAADNRRFRERVRGELRALQQRHGARIGPEFTLDSDNAVTPLGVAREMPDVVIAAADENGHIVRYFEARDTAAYFGSAHAHDPDTGLYDPEREVRSIASIGKIIPAIAIANEGKDTLATSYLDDNAPAKGLETCQRRGGQRHGRTAEVTFACSLNRPLELRAARLGQRPIRRLIDGFGFNMPPAPTPETETPPSTAAVHGFITGSPRRVHQMAGVVLAALTGRGDRLVGQPTLVRGWDRHHGALDDGEATPFDIRPDDLIKRGSAARLAQFLSAPLCYEFRGKRHGTMKELADWCASRRSDVTLHFAKTGTSVTEDPDATVDVWAAGGIKFSSGRQFSYVVLVGTGSTSRPWARSLHASQVAAPLVRILLEDLKADVSRGPAVATAPRQGT
ncbi:MAG: glycosyl transferase family 51 [Rhizobiales bacterium]|nr:glycosyl transferase family 51 [Hyphomicrobiales bacterium]